MSRKTISIRMPSAEPADAGAASAAGSAGAGGRALEGGFESDRWISGADLISLPESFRARSTPPGRALLGSSPPFATIDLSADRTFAQVLTLSFVLPYALGWFWLANSLDRCRRLFAI
jgi:hypothetical protein